MTLFVQAISEREDASRLAPRTRPTHWPSERARSPGLREELLAQHRGRLQARGRPGGAGTACRWKQRRLGCGPTDSTSHRRAFPDVDVSAPSSRRSAKAHFTKCRSVLEAIIVGFQKKRKPGWPSISALSEKPQKPQQARMRQRRASCQTWGGGRESSLPS